MWTPDLTGACASKVGTYACGVQAGTRAPEGWGVVARICADLMLSDHRHRSSSVSRALVWLMCLADVFG